MLETILVFVVGLTPPVICILAMQKAKKKEQARLREAIRTPPPREVSREQFPIDQYYLEGVGYLIGDITCRFNARSAYIRCGVNPSGPCENCHDYEPNNDESDEDL
ncbi:MAG TPA: hypothetical protein DEG17_23230 [Cyanobacteria bacterium UBA11149]|nr:hypothetical protein [Cyanobacteria bacterium UBA11367]HBE58543.1 hypothetical protein [Cyanobacteria bacterium UBA11366]HBK62128.1 hypothetical protein [Cyanobacteria bacterium UBA11166]HBR72250.1 hypothetical protein [Cyanobacteria bacterium UBA11159]HBS72021.1 hypothetical protein [Cyanobacteria bacterium UBA11153]HBW91695.1 hypothetical protein [Cyanobacteria bacterium UBA11149]HCA95712.1 hypothetical protein [Cyanobacteria bacterium UBA9226]